MNKTTSQLASLQKPTDFGFGNSPPDPSVIVDIIFLATLTICGTAGNLLIICSVIHAKTVLRNGNVFIINLACADLTITGFVQPIIVANVISNSNVLSNFVCEVVAYVMAISFLSSANNLACIALNRYLFVVHHQTYKRVFKKKTFCAAAIFCWAWANFLMLPTLLHWSSKNLRYDKEMLMCRNHVKITAGHSVASLMVSAFLPFIITVVCYWRLFTYTARKGRNIRRFTAKGHRQSSNLLKRRLREQFRLAVTLTVAVFAFLLSWTPYGIVMLLDQSEIPDAAKKIAARILLANSSVNFVIYGIKNPVFRKNYAEFIRFFFCTNTVRKVMVKLHLPTKR